MGYVEDWFIHHVPKDLAVPKKDGVGQDQTIVAPDASGNTATVTTYLDVDQALVVYHVLKDLAALN
jgi:hypothetical protein